MDAAAAAEEEEGEEDRLRWALDMERMREAGVWSAEVERGRTLEVGHRAAMAEAQWELGLAHVDLVEDLNERNYWASERRVGRLVAAWNRDAALDLGLRNQALSRAEAAERRAEAAERRAEAAERRATEEARRGAAARAAAAAAVARLGAVVLD